MSDGSKVCSHSYHDRVYAKHTCPVNTNVCGSSRDHHFVEPPLPAEEEDNGDNEGEVEEPEEPEEETSASNFVFESKTFSISGLPRG